MSKNIRKNILLFSVLAVTIIGSVNSANLDEQLYNAVIANDISEVGQLLNIGADPNYYHDDLGIDFKTPLHAVFGDFETQANVLSIPGTRYDIKLLDVVVNLSVLKKLLDDPRIDLFATIISGKMRIFELVGGARILTSNSSGDTVLHLAAEAGNLDAVELILNKALERFGLSQKYFDFVTAKNKIGHSAFDLAKYKTQDPKDQYSMIMERLLEALDWPRNYLARSLLLGKAGEYLPADVAGIIGDYISPQPTADLITKFKDFKISAGLDVFRKNGKGFYELYLSRPDISQIKAMLEQGIADDSYSNGMVINFDPDVKNVSRINVALLYDSDHKIPVKNLWISLAIAILYKFGIRRFTIVTELGCGPGIELPRDYYFASEELTRDDIVHRNLMSLKEIKSHFIQAQKFQKQLIDNNQKIVIDFTNGRFLGYIDLAMPAELL